MKKTLIVLLSVMLLLSLIPATVFAAEPAELKVRVRNTSGGDVDLKLTAEDGSVQYITLPNGVYETTLMEGKYQYYAVMPCGTQFGEWNLNVSKTLYLQCKDGQPIVDLQYCPNNYWGEIYIIDFPLGANAIHTAIPAGPIVLYAEKGAANIPDLFGSVFLGATFSKQESKCWSDMITKYDLHLRTPVEDSVWQFFSIPTP